MKQGDTLSLPKGWEIKKLGEVCENLDSKRIPITQSKRTKGDIPYYGASGIVDYVSDYIFDEDLLCVSEDGANLLARTYPIAFSISGKTWVNNHAHVLRFKNFNTQKFIELYLNSIRVDDYVSGMAQPKLNQAMLNKIPIPLPPLPEQQRIVSILDEAFEVIERSRNAAIKNLKNAKELFESYLQGLFENGNWETKTLNQISENLDSKRVPITKNQRKSGDIPYYGASGIVDYVADYLFNEDLLCVSEDGANLLTRTYPIAFSISGKTWVNNHTHVLKFPNTVTQKFVEVYINSIRIDDYVSGMAQPKLNQAMLNKIPIPIPSIEEQQTIVRQLDALRAETQKLEAVYQKKIEDLEELKKSILQKAFAGELRGGEPVELKTEKAVAV
ncbi:restriction endonuclease subunit S [bacterium]|nr:restriction endonuclease subunit S [bacterium]